MDKEKMNYFKEKLLSEKKKVNDLLKQMKNNETIDSKSEFASELSIYDNHPSDVATELSDIEKGMAFKSNEKSIEKKIDDALKSIEKGTYGKCKMCGKDIKEERLEFLPYAEHCIKCQSIVNRNKKKILKNIPVEEKIITNPFSRGFNDNTSSVEFDAEDSYQKVDSFNKMKHLGQYYDEDNDYVEEVEGISNDQYKNQLPN